VNRRKIMNKLTMLVVAALAAATVAVGALAAAPCDLRRPAAPRFAFNVLGSVNVRELTRRGPRRRLGFDPARKRRAVRMAVGCWSVSAGKMQAKELKRYRDAVLEIVSLPNIPRASILFAKVTFKAQPVPGATERDYIGAIAQLYADDWLVDSSFFDLFNRGGSSVTVPLHGTITLPLSTAVRVDKVTRHTAVLALDSSGHSFEIDDVWLSAIPIGGSLQHSGPRPMEIE
jgi:hypothetical protein